MPFECSVSVVVCSYNRAETLAVTLADLTESTVPSSVRWEVLVVDNNSGDRTSEVGQDFESRFPGRFRYVFESHAGKSYALNHAIREARGEIIAFLDDDVRVGPDWLRNVVAAFENPEVAGVGGRVLLDWTCDPPQWLAVEGQWNLAGVLAQFDLGDQMTRLEVAPIGANMAVRRSVFDELGGYRTDLGPSPDPTIPRPSEDAEFGRRMMAAGKKLFYVPSAVVHHPVPESRLKKSYFLNWWFDYGRAVIRERGPRPALFNLIPRHFMSIPRLLGTHLTLRTLRWVSTTEPKRRFFRKTEVWRTMGMIVEIPRVSARASRSARLLETGRLG